MRTIFPLALLLLAATLRAEGNTEAAMKTAPAIEIHTFGVSCYGESNGSTYLRSDSTNWNLSLYHNGQLLNNFTVAGCDTFISGLSIGCYRFIYTTKNGEADTINRVVSGPAEVVSAFRISYPERPHVYAASFTNISTGAVQFDWDFGDGEHSAEISPEHHYAAPGTYTVTLTAFSRGGCATRSTHVVNIPPDSRT